MVLMGCFTMDQWPAILKHLLCVRHQIKHFTCSIAFILTITLEVCCHYPHPVNEEAEETVCDLGKVTQFGMVGLACEPVLQLWAQPSLALLWVVALHLGHHSCRVPASHEQRQWEAHKGHRSLYLRPSFILALEKAGRMTLTVKLEALITFSPLLGTHPVPVPEFQPLGPAQPLLTIECFDSKRK